MPVEDYHLYGPGKVGLRKVLGAISMFRARNGTHDGLVVSVQPGDAEQELPAVVDDVQVRLDTSVPVGRIRVSSD